MPSAETFPKRWRATRPRLSIIFHQKGANILSKSWMSRESESEREGARLETRFSPEISRIRSINKPIPAIYAGTCNPKILQEWLLVTKSPTRPVRYLLLAVLQRTRALLPRIVRAMEPPWYNRSRPYSPITVRWEGGQRCHDTARGISTEFARFLNRGWSGIFEIEEFFENYFNPPCVNSFVVIIIKFVK